MDPISLIIAALGAGAIAAAKDTAGTAVKDAYQELKTLIKNKFAEQGKADSSTILDKFEQKPEKTKALLEDELVESGLGQLDKDAEIIKLAQELLKQEKPEESAAGKYNTQVAGDFKGSQGDISGGTLNQTFN
ncbi:hypothetical protein [Nostoc sp.]